MKVQVNDIIQTVTGLELKVVYVEKYPTEDKNYYKLEVDDKRSPKTYTTNISDESILSIQECSERMDLKPIFYYRLNQGVIVKEEYLYLMRDEKRLYLYDKDTLRVFRNRLPVRLSEIEVLTNGTLMYSFNGNYEKQFSYIVKEYLEALLKKKEKELQSVQKRIEEITTIQEKRHWKE